MVKTRRLPEPITIESGLPQNIAYCRKCQKLKKDSDFYKATDLVLDSNGKMSVCKDCINEMYVLFLDSEHGSIFKAVLKLCRMLNVKYDEGAISSALEHMKIRESDETKFFGFYRLKLLTNNRTDMSDTSIDLTYKDNPIIIHDVISDDSFDGAGEELKYKWGENFEEEDYIWLEKEYGEWRARHRIDTKSQEELLKMIVLKSFDIRQARKEGKDASSLEKAFRDLLNTSALSPLHMNAADSGENKDVFGLWIASIEKEEPAEWLEHEGRPLYKDVDNIEQYFQDYFVRPLKNFILQSKSFNVSDDDVSNDDIESFIDSDSEMEDQNNDSEESPISI